jgi:hypothetical protein
MVADLVHFARCVVDSDHTIYIVMAFSSCRLAKVKHARQRVVLLSSCFPDSREARQTARSREARCRDVALSLVSHSFEPSNNVTSRQLATGQRTVLHESLATGRHDENPTTRRLAL